MRRILPSSDAPSTQIRSTNRRSNGIFRIGLSASDSASGRIGPASGLSTILRSSLWIQSGGWTREGLSAKLKMGSEMWWPQKRLTSSLTVSFTIKWPLIFSSKTMAFNGIAFCHHKSDNNNPRVTLNSLFVCISCLVVGPVKWSVKEIHRCLIWSPWLFISYNSSKHWTLIFLN